MCDAVYSPTSIARRAPQTHVGHYAHVESITAYVVQHCLDDSIRIQPLPLARKTPASQENCNITIIFQQTINRRVLSKVSQGILIVSAQLKDRAVDARFSPLAIRGIDIEERPRQTRIPAEVLYQLLLFSPTPTAEEVLRELYLRECD